MASSAVWLGVLVVLGGTAAVIATAAFRRPPALPPAADPEPREAASSADTAETAPPAEAGDEAVPVVYDFAYEIVGAKEPPPAAADPVERLVLELNRLYADPPPGAVALPAAERSRLLTEAARRVLRPGPISTGRAGDGTVVWAARLNGPEPVTGDNRDCLFVMPGTLFGETLTAAFLGAPKDEEGGTVTLVKVAFRPKCFVVRAATVELAAVRDADKTGPLTAALGDPARNLLDAIVSLSLGTPPAPPPGPAGPEPA